MSTRYQIQNHLSNEETELQTNTQIIVDSKAEKNKLDMIRIIKVRITSKKEQKKIESLKQEV